MSTAVKASSNPKTASASSDRPAILANGLTKRFGSFCAVADLSFEIGSGQLVAFLGPNGAGKSTTMRLLTGYLTPTSGSASILGHDVSQDRVAAAEKLGYLPENGPLYPDLNPLGLLRFLGRARGMAPGAVKERIQMVVSQCRLEEVAGRSIGKLSKGFRQRVGIAAALLHDPQVLILDEPTAGLDPNQVEQMRQLLSGLAKTRTILLSTHILSEVRALATRILLVHRGRLVHDGPAGSLGREEREMESRFRQLTSTQAA